MSRQINQPINQVRLTNVAVVRMNKGGKRFEIACYRNKVMDYRNRLETDLSEVLQTDRIFTNVSKGQFAKHSDLQKVFHTKDEEAIAKLILDQGQLQVSDLERQSQLENSLAQIATWVANNCVHPTSQRPYTISQIRHALGKQYQVQTHKAMKRQYLDAVKFLKSVIPIERAKMELALSYQADSAEVERKVQQALKEHDMVVTETNRQVEHSTLKRLTLLVDPSLYRVLDDLAKTLPQGKLVVQQQVVTQEGDIDLELELERKEKLDGTTGSKDDGDNDGDNDSDGDDEHAADQLARQLQQTARIHNDENGEEDDNHNNDDSDNSDSDNDAPVNRKQQSQQKKKLSKKAKRRQREEQAEREARRREEEARQAERVGSGGATAVVQANAAAQADTDGGGGNKSCNTCGGNFTTAAAYRAHFRTDWHRFNQKLKLQGMPSVSEEEFNLCDADSFFGGT